MLKREITYTDFNDQKCTEVFYFNLSKPEVMEMLVEPDEGLDKWLERILATNNNRELLAQFQKIILSSYGERSGDGKRFIKTPEAKAEFAQTAAYDALFGELTTDEKAAADFVIGIVPSDLQQMADAAERASAEKMIAQAQARVTP